MKVLLYTCLYNVSLNVLRPTFFNIYNLPFSLSLNIGEIGFNFGPKTNCFSYFMSSSTNRIAVFYNFYSLICSHPVDEGRKLNVHKTFRRRPRCLLNVLCTFNLRPVYTGQPRDKKNRARDFLLSKYFLNNNLLLTISMQSTLSKLVELLQ